MTKKKENELKVVNIRLVKEPSLYSTESGCETYLAIRENELVGFSVSVTENGFGGVMSLMVGLDTNGAVCGIEIVSMAETPGIGTKTKSPTASTTPITEATMPTIV